MASIKRRPDRNNRWQATVRVDGKERARLFDKKVDAERWVTGTQHAIHSGAYIDPSLARTTLATYADKWLERMAPTWRQSTADVVTNNLRRHVLPVLGGRPVSAIRRSDVEALYASLDLAPSTVATVHQHLGQLLTGAAEDGLIPRNPATRARLPKLEPTKAQPVQPEVVSAITASLPQWMSVVVPLGVGCGLRQGEVSGLTVDRIDFLRRTLRVDRQLVSRHAGGARLMAPKTPCSNRTIPLASFVVDALADHLRRFPAEPGELVIRNPNGYAVRASIFSNAWRPAVAKAGAEGIGYHSLRHTFASTLLSRGVSVKAVADWLGHSSPAITLTTYAHLMPADEDVARTVLDAVLAPGADQTRTAEGLRAL